jgi:transposase InsO family protein
LYLAVVIDLFSQQIVGWSMAEHMRAKLVNDALLMAVWKRKPAKAYSGIPTEEANMLPKATVHY